MAESNGAGRRLLKDKEKFRLWNLLNGNREKIEAGEMGRLSELAPALSAELGFSVSDQNIKRSCQVLGIKLKRGGARPKESRASEELADLRRRVEAIESALSQWSQKLGGG